MQSLKLIAIILSLVLAVVAQENRSEAGLQGGMSFTRNASGQEITRHSTDTGSGLRPVRRVRCLLAPFQFFQDGAAIGLSPARMTRPCASGT